MNISIVGLIIGLLEVIAIIAFMVIIVIALTKSLFSTRSKDRRIHPEEWKDVGKAGEQILFLTLRDEVHVPENQILRNVYIPTKDGKTSEIDILVVSKKGLLVFECKNYAGNIYGDMKRKKWVQYLGNKKSFFYNPFLQNQTHIDNLKAFLGQYGDLPATSFVTTISRGKWKVKNLGPNDYFLGYNCHLVDVLKTIPDSKIMVKHFMDIMQKLTPLSRPSQLICEEHVEQIKKHSK